MAECPCYGRSAKQKGRDAVRSRFVVFAFIILCAMRPQAAAADSGVTACTGFVDALPALIETPGVWCLRRNLAVKPTLKGSAITVAADNVTLDCGRFGFGPRLANPRSERVGISAFERRNVSIRRCSVRNFWIGIILAGGRGHAVEDNLIEGSTYAGLYVRSAGSTIRRNRVLDTGGSATIALALGIFASGDADILDNLIAGVEGTAIPGLYYGSTGIFAPESGMIARNRIRGLSPGSTGQTYAIWAGNTGNSRVRIHGNDLVGPTGAGTGVMCYGDRVLVDGNAINGFRTAVDPSCRAANNLFVP